MNVAHVVQTGVLRTARHQQNRPSGYSTGGVWRHGDPNFAFPVVEHGIERKVRQAPSCSAPSIVNRPVRERIGSPLRIRPIASDFGHRLACKREAEESGMLVNSPLA